MPGCVRDQFLEFAQFTRQHPLGLLNPTVDVFRWLEVTLQRSLPVNAHGLASGHLDISMTRITDRKNVLVSEFHSNEDLIKALLYSCSVPVYSGMIPPQYKHYMDGCFTNIQPFEDSSPTLTTSPFAEEMDICPSDTSATLCDVIIQQLSFQFSLTNFIRLVDAMFPQDWRVLKKAFYSGYQDTVYFLQQNKVDQEKECQQKSLEHPEEKSANGVCLSMGPSHKEQSVHKNSPVNVQEVLLCNIVGQTEIMSNPSVSLSQRTLSHLLFLFTLTIWSTTTFMDRY
ncbi:patatin-like phospholipase domain-containing protein 2 [Myxocyprinus asiaticus]|uniref:patatin-like phospholipase domain-containing protein 2 n=1 Tax=Myxocyprinus asiaticus TaxID=70543 RepID=UPI002223B2EA|nr:patatin-like phospholipase domain-containing protein 2 [Myxocyprinus asiaticus]